MRAICCAILAIVFYGMGAVSANSNIGGNWAAVHILLSYVSVVFAIGLCIAGL